MQKSSEPNPSSIPQFNGKNACKIIKDLRGQIIIITGCSSGIGKETARTLAYMSATIIFACRSQAKTVPVLEEIQKESKNPNLVFIKLDLSDLKSIKEFVQEFTSRYQKLDILINNAGVNATERKLTKDGFELTFGTNHLGHFYLTSLLLDLLKRSVPSRVINLSSSMHKDAKIKWDDLMYEKGFGWMPVYGQSKLACHLFTKELQRRVNESEVKVVCLNPGHIKSDIGRDFGRNCWLKFTMALFNLITKSPLEGAQTELYCTLEDFDKLKGGAYYQDCQVAEEGASAKKEEDWKRLWEVSEKLISEKINN